MKIYKRNFVREMENRIMSSMDKVPKIYIYTNNCFDSIFNRMDTAETRIIVQEKLSKLKYKKKNNLNTSALQHPGDVGQYYMV